MARRFTVEDDVVPNQGHLDVVAQFGSGEGELRDSARFSPRSCRCPGEIAYDLKLKLSPSVDDSEIVASPGQAAICAVPVSLPPSNLSSSTISLTIFGRSPIGPVKVAFHAPFRSAAPALMTAVRRTRYARMRPLSSSVHIIRALDSSGFTQATPSQDRPAVADICLVSINSASDFFTLFLVPGPGTCPMSHLKG